MKFQCFNVEDSKLASREPCYLCFLPGLLLCMHTIARILLRETDILGELLNCYPNYVYHSIGEKELAAELEKMYGDIDALEFLPGLYLEKTRPMSPFPSTVVEIGAPFSVKGLLCNPVSSPQYWKPSTFGGDVGFEIVKTATLEKLFCQNIQGDCPLVTFRVPVEIAREQRREKHWNKYEHNEL